MKDKPQLSAEMEAKLMFVVHENWHSGAGEIIDFNKFLDELKHFLATALDEQRRQIYGEVLKIDVQDYLDDQGRNAIILRDDVLAILNGKEA